MDFHFAQLNVGRLLEPLDHADSAEFVAALDAINQIAERTPGFVWRLRDDDGRSASYVHAYDDPLIIINLTVWTGIEPLRHFTYKSGHGAYFRRRREWFEPAAHPHMVCWWVPAGALPTPDDAIRRLDVLRAHGPRPDGFLLADPHPAPHG